MAAAVGAGVFCVDKWGGKGAKFGLYGHTYSRFENGKTFLVVMYVPSLIQEANFAHVVIIASTPPQFEIVSYCIVGTTHF